MKIIGIILLILITGFLLFYLWPVPQRSFDKLNSKVADSTSASLLSFRQNNPLQELAVNNTVWKYLAIGQGEETILFLHGMTGAYDIWWQQMEALKAHYRVISVTYPAVDSLEELSQGVLSILKTEDIDKVKVVGTSLGGYLAQYLLAKYPQMVTHAVFANSFAPNDIIAQKNRKIGSALPYLPEWLVIKVLRGSFHEKVYPASANDELTLAYMLEQSYGRMSKAQVIGRFHCVIDSFSPNISSGIPIMIIEADNDPLVEEALREQLKETYPTATVHTMHNLGHFPYLNRPTEYTGFLQEFFAVRR